MRNKINTLLSWLLATCMVLFTHTTQATPITRKQASVKHLTVKIKQVKRSIVNAKNKRSDLIQTLRHSEMTMDHLYRHLDKLKKDLSWQQRRINKLTRRQTEQQAKLLTQQQLLAKQFKAAYQLGQHDAVKLILDQQDPAKIDRLLSYYGYLNKARFELIQQIKHTLLALQQRQQHIGKQTRRLKNLVSEQNHKQHNLTQQQTLRNRVLSKLTQRIVSKQDQLKQLKQNKSNLEQVIKRLQIASSTVLQPSQPFAKLRHHLPWPTSGPIIRTFGTAIAESELRYNGVFIQARQGQAVKAIYPGRVVFANWLRGFGLLLIIDHGDGFMTLYAHNQSLYKQAGDRVKAGNLISTVGHSGGNQQSGLYFEIRHRAKPLNPKRWCNRAIRFIG